MTINAARQIGQGDRVGSLEKGKEADFTILESDPYKVSPDAIADIKVSETWVAGEWKFAAQRIAAVAMFAGVTADCTGDHGHGSNSRCPTAPVGYHR